MENKVLISYSFMVRELTIIFSLIEEKVKKRGGKKKSARPPAGRHIADFSVLTPVS